MCHKIYCDNLEIKIIILKSLDRKLWRGVSSVTDLLVKGGKVEQETADFEEGRKGKELRRHRNAWPNEKRRGAAVKKGSIAAATT